MDDVITYAERSRPRVVPVGSSVDQSERARQILADPVLQRMLEHWWEHGWAEFMGRSPTPDDLIFPRLFAGSSVS